MSFFFKAVCVNCLVRAGMAGHTYSHIFLVQCSAVQCSAIGSADALHSTWRVSVFGAFSFCIFPSFFLQEKFLCIENKFVVDNQTSRF